MNPPNYRKGTTEEHCGNCGAFSRILGEERTGFCNMFGQVVEAGKTCDKWYPRKVRVKK